MAKRAGRVHVRVGSIGSRVKTGHGSKRVIFKWVNRVTGQRVAGQTGLTRFAMSNFIAFYVSFLFYNNYLVNGCIGVFSFEPYLELMPSSIELFIKIDEHNSADFK